MSEASHANAARHPNGSTVAAFLAAALGLLALGLVQLQSERDEGFKEDMQELGNAWIPHAEHIGPYSGKETVLLVTWLLSWVILDRALHRRDLNVKVWFGVAFVLLVVAVLLVWPPVWHAFA